MLLKHCGKREAPRSLPSCCRGRLQLLGRTARLRRNHGPRVRRMGLVFHRVGTRGRQILRAQEVILSQDAGFRSQTAARRGCSDQLHSLLVAYQLNGLVPANRARRRLVSDKEELKRASCSDWPICFDKGNIPALGLMNEWTVSWHCGAGTKLRVARFPSASKEGGGLTWRPRCGWSRCQPESLHLTSNSKRLG